MYHGIPLDYHLFVLVFAILAWAGRLLYKGFQKISRQVRGVSPGVPKLNPMPQAIAEARQQSIAQGQRPEPPLTPRASQALPYRTAPLGRARELPRRPEAGGPVVPREATADEMRRQERELFASEPSALAVPLTDSPAAPAAGIPRALFGDTDDLVRAIILQEVLGPPLSRRSSQTPSPPPR